MTDDPLLQVGTSDTVRVTVGNGGRARWLLYALLLFFGWIGADVVGPGARLTRLEAQQAQTDSTLQAHLLWANTQRDRILELVEALARVKCIENRGSQQALDLLEAAHVPCDYLLGNRLPTR